jgi:hypothetical protein
MVTKLCFPTISDLRHVGGFLLVLRFPPSIKLTTTKLLKTRLQIQAKGSLFYPLIKITTCYTMYIYYRLNDWLIDLLWLTPLPTIFQIYHGVSDFRQVGGFLLVLRFPPSIKLTTTKLLKYCWKWHKTA